MAKYPYTILPSPDTGKVYKPLIPVHISNLKTHKTTSVAINALVDSGADVCFCALNIGIWLGINFKNKKPSKFTAANNQTFNTYKESIKLHVCGKSYNCTFYFSDELIKMAPIILGQLGFFDHFKISFDLKNQEMDIT